MPAVSVIVPTFNSAESLRLALASVRAQTFQDYDVWVVGDACADDSGDVVAELGDPRFHWVNLDRRHGNQAGPNNEGLRRSRAPLISYLGHDDLWLPYHLETLMRAMHASNADLVHSLCPVIGPTGVFGCCGRPRRGRTYAWHFVPPSSWMHRRDLIDRIGPWRDADSLAWAVDFDVTRRAFLAGARIECVDRITLLKFPSAEFRAYARDAVRPQPAYWDRIVQDAAAVELEVATVLAGLFAEDRHGGDASMGSVAQLWWRMALRRLRQRTLGSPLVASLERWRQKRQRRRRRAARGLD